MNVTLELPPEKLAAWRIEAAAHGLTLESWIQTIADAHIQGAGPAADRPIWGLIASRVNALGPEAFENQPTDGASEHDHYLYGHPKRNR